MDKQGFTAAYEKVMAANGKTAGIGTLGEKTLHAVLKHYFEPFVENHEVKVGNFVADIVSGRGIIEIQTRDFNKLRSKLQIFLEINTVTIVYPVAKTKWLLWINEETGEITKKRKSTKQGTAYEVFQELYKIKPMLSHPNLRICIVGLDIEEYRYLSGWSEDKKRGSTRANRIPVDIEWEQYINDVYDYQKLIPEELEQQFTSKDYKRTSRLSMSHSQTALNVLNHIGATKRVGKQGNLYVYERTIDDNIPAALPHSLTLEIPG